MHTFITGLNFLPNPPESTKIQVGCLSDQSFDSLLRKIIKCPIKNVLSFKPSVDHHKTKITIDNKKSQLLKSLETNPEKSYKQSSFPRVPISKACCSNTATPRHRTQWQRQLIAKETGLESPWRLNAAAFLWAAAVWQNKYLWPGTSHVIRGTPSTQALH